MKAERFFCTEREESKVVIWLSDDDVTICWLLLFPGNRFHEGIKNVIG